MHRDLSSAPLALTADQELVIYRVAQEALTNAARHAHAESVRLSLVQSDGAVELQIADDGRGLNGRDNGAGIRGMRERALLVNGQLTVESPASGGTKVRLVVPATADPTISQLEK